jgi:hypothetical protein
MNAYNWTAAVPSALRSLPHLATFSVLQQELVGQSIAYAYNNGMLKMADHVGNMCMSTATTAPYPFGIESMAAMPLTDNELAHDLPNQIMVQLLKSACCMANMSHKQLAMCSSADKLKYLSRTIVTSLATDTRNMKYSSDLAIAGIRDNKIVNCLTEYRRLVHHNLKLPTLTFRLSIVI